MRKFAMYAAAAAALAGMGGVASAADLGGYKDEPVYAAAPFSWTGFYIGGHGGGGWGDSNWDYAGSSLATEMSPSGGLGGIQAGYNLQAGAIVLGLEGSVSWASLEDSVTYRDGGTNWTDTTEVTWLGDASIRAGLALDRTLLFVKTGVAWGGFEHDSYNHLTRQNWHAGTDNQVGWVIGGGAEFALTNNLSAKVEYNYNEFFDNGSFSLGNGPRYEQVGADQSVSVVKGGINYRFGAGGLLPLK